MWYTNQHMNVTAKSNIFPLHFGVRNSDKANGHGDDGDASDDVNADNDFEKFECLTEMCKQKRDIYKYFHNKMSFAIEFTVVLCNFSSSISVLCILHKRKVNDKVIGWKCLSI